MKPFPPLRGVAEPLAKPLAKPLASGASPCFSETEEEAKQIGLAMLATAAKQIREAGAG